MKLINDLFYVKNSVEQQNGTVFSIELNPNHIVFEGHFPGQPVTPGVIQLQIVHELLEAYLNRSLKLTSIQTCKFLNIINPVETNKLDILIFFKENDGVLNIRARSEYQSKEYFKMKALYTYI